MSDGDMAQISKVMNAKEWIVKSYPLDTVVQNT